MSSAAVPGSISPGSLKSAAIGGRDNEPLPAAEESSPVFRDSGVSYLRIPATDPQASAAFYESVFGWAVNVNRPDPSFEDGTGHVIGHFSADHAVAGEAGIRPYVYVRDVEETLRRRLTNVPEYPVSEALRDVRYGARFRRRCGRSYTSSDGSLRTAHPAASHAVCFRSSSPTSRWNGPPSISTIRCSSGQLRSASP